MYVLIYTYNSGLRWLAAYQSCDKYGSSQDYFQGHIFKISLKRVENINLNNIRPAFKITIPTNVILL